MPRGVYPRKPRPCRDYVLRTLRPDEPRPQGEPRRYPDQTGYIRLRWKVGIREYVEIREHRAVMAAGPDVHVHHRNHVKSDNRPENLTPLSPVAHGKKHAAERLEERGHGFELDRARDLYAQGLSTIQIGELLGVDHSNVWRGLDRAGVRMRTVSEAAERRCLPLDEARVLALHDAGWRAKAIGRLFGCSDTPIRRVLRAHGRRSHRPGRPEVRRAA